MLSPFGDPVTTKASYLSVPVKSLNKKGYMPNWLGTSVNVF
jgi:hypothetical protein